MLNNLKSEVIKIKNSKHLLLTFTYKIIEIIGVIGLSLYPSSQNIEELIIYLPILMLPIIISLQVSFMDEQEKKANDYQNIIFYREKNYQVKKILILIFNVVPYFMTILLVRRLANRYLIILAYILLNYLIISLHITLIRRLKMIGLSIMGFIETLLILFSTNNVFLKIPIFLVTGPVNIIVKGKIEQIDCYSIIFWVILITFFKKVVDRSIVNVVNY